MAMLRTIPFSEFYLWDVKRFSYIKNGNFENSITLRNILQPYKVKVSKKELIENQWQIIAKINFHGKLFLRAKEGIQLYKGELNKVPDNAIIYSKINVRHGCVYFHEKGALPFGVSNEYPIFTFDDNRINGQFLKHVLRSEGFKSLLDSKTSGISKARVKVDEFLSINIPLPTIAEQNRIVAAYNAKIALAEQQEAQSEELLNKLPEIVRQALGIKAISTTFKDKSRYLKIINFSAFFKWGVDAQSNADHQYTSPYPVSRVSQLCDVGSGGTPLRNKSDYYGGTIPWIKTGEVLNEVIYDSEEKITQQAVSESSAKLYPKGSLIIAMYGQGLTRGRTAKLGIDATTNQACAVLSNIDNDKILTDYFWIYLMSEYNHLRELASGNNQPNLNAQMIKNYPVVIPPLEIQTKIIADYLDLKSQIKNLNAKAEQNKLDAIKAFEQAIFNQ